MTSDFRFQPHQLFFYLSSFLSTYHLRRIFPSNRPANVKRTNEAKLIHSSTTKDQTKPNDRQCLLDKSTSSLRAVALVPPRVSSPLPTKPSPRPRTHPSCAVSLCLVYVYFLALTIPLENGADSVVSRLQWLSSQVHSPSSFSLRKIDLDMNPHAYITS